MADKEDKQRLGGGYAYPENLLIPGVDPEPEGLSEANHERWAELIEEMRLARTEKSISEIVPSIQTHGVREAVDVCVFRVGKSDRLHVVLDGRRRVRAARIVNADRASRGDDSPARVPYIVKDGDAFDVIIANEHRVGYSALEKAHKIEQLSRRHATAEEIRTAFSSDDGSVVGRVTIANWRSLLKLPEELQAALQSGELTPTGGYALAKLPSHAAMIAAWQKAHAASDMATRAAIALAAAPDVAPSAAPDVAPSAPARPPAPTPKPTKAPTARAIATAAAVTADPGHVVAPTMREINLLRSLLQDAEDTNETLVVDGTEYEGQERLWIDAVSATLQWATGNMCAEDAFKSFPDMKIWIRKISSAPTGATPKTKKPVLRVNGDF